MSVNLLNLFNQINSTVIQGNNDNTKFPDLSVNTQSGNAGLDMLKNMLAGDTFTGKVLSVTDNNVMLSVNNGNNIMAHLSEGVNITPGQNMTFIVEGNSNNSISIKPLPINEQQMLMATKALDAAGFPDTAANLNIVSQLINSGMSIDAKMIGEMVKYSTKFPETDINTIANLIKYDIPVTIENIGQYEAYKTYEHSILNRLNEMSLGIKEFIVNITDSLANNDVNSEFSLEANNKVNSLLSFIDGLYIDNSTSGLTDSGTVESAKLNTILPNESLSLLQETINNLKNNLTDESAIGYLDKLAVKVERGEITVKEFLTEITGMLKDKPELSKQFGSVLKSDSFNVIINQMINETMKITPQDIAKSDGIKKYYKRVRAALEKSGEMTKDLPEASSLNKNMDSIKANIDFMNDLNKNMVYFQMPVKLKGGDANGELYVFTNKRALADNPESVSALLHLDMDNLGPIDVYVKLAGKNVTTNFCLESEELLDFVNSHIDKLNKRLESLGYSTKFEMNVTNESNKFKPPVVMNDNKNVELTSQFILDVKA